MHRNWLFIILFFVPVSIYSQVTIGSSIKPSEEALLELKDMMQEASDEDVALSYAKLAKELIIEKEYEKSVNYYQKARKLYEKLTQKEKIAGVDRELGKLYEKLNNTPLALQSYQSAHTLFQDSIQQAINLNDINRLESNDLKKQEEEIEKNITILEKIDDKEGKAEAYKQKADVSLKMDNKDAALENLEKAKENSERSESNISIDKQIVDIYSSEKDLDRAESKSLEIIAQAQSTNNVKAEIEQLQTLSDIYFDKNKTDKGFDALQKAYNLSIERGRTMDAKNSLQMLVNRYQENKNTKEALGVYSQFLNQLEPLVKGDSTLMNSKIFQFNEERIEQLETERELKDELIDRTNTVNYILIGSICIIIIFLFFISRALFSIKKKNKQIALQSLRREMNPHFIFNSLNSVNQFIAQNNELEANKYLSSYSKLMRNMMENSNRDFVMLSSELEQLKEYLDLEYMRFGDKFAYRIDVDDTIDVDAVLIPNMLIQPQLENAIWHGLRYKETKGNLLLSVKYRGDKIIIEVNDDGIGLAKSAALKTKHQRNHQSRGVNNTMERVKLLNDLYKRDISIDIKEKETPETGVIVTLSFSLLKK